MSRMSGSMIALIALGVLSALLMIPVLSFPLMLLFLPWIAGLLVHVVLIALAVESLTGVRPREFILIPILAYGGYYAMYAFEGYIVTRKSAELRATNPGQIFTFDPSQHSLVTSGAEALAGTHEIPVVYEPNLGFRPERHLAHRLIPRAHCGTRGDSQGRVMWMGVHFDGKLQNGVCRLRMAEAPPHNVVHATKRGDETYNFKPGFLEQTTDIIFGGAVIGVYRTASIWRLLPVPMIVIGCGLNGKGPGPDCGAEFTRKVIAIDAVPDRVDRAVYDTPLSVMLGLRKYTAADFANFKGYPQNASGLARAAEERTRVEDSVFTDLERILDGQDLEPPFRMGYSLALNPPRLAPYAARMVERFAELTSSQHSVNRQSRADALATALAALPRAAFADIAGRIFELIQNPAVAQRYVPLYVRAAEAGPQTLPFYQTALMVARPDAALRAAPILAICRIGHADSATIAEMKRRFAEDKPIHLYARPDLLVALVKLGEEPFVRENIKMIPDRLQGWANLVLSGEATTEVGPNNCVGEKWGLTDYLAPAMAPVIEWNGGWKRRAGA